MSALASPTLDSTRPATARQLPRHLRPRWTEWAAACSLLAIAVLAMGSPGAALHGSDWFAAGLGSLVQAGSLLTSRRAGALPTLALNVGALVATVTLLGDPVATDVGVAFALYAVAVQHRTLVTWLAWGAALATSWLTYLAALDMPTGTPAPTQVEALLTAILGLLLVSLVALALGLTVRGRRVQVAALEERARQLVLERDQREQLAAANERARMAREMHDVVAHSVAVMVTLAHGAAASLGRHPERSREALVELSSTGREALQDMRRIVGLLRDEEAEAGAASPGEPVTISAPPSIAELVETFRSAGLPVRLVERGPGLPQDLRLRHAVFRVVQESLTNVLRHAPQANRVEVQLDRTEYHVTVTVTDSGPRAGADASGGGRGLAGMRERVAAHHGTVHAGPALHGWKVSATLLYDEETP